MSDLLTPKQVARGIDVSESSIKRWCDKGEIPTQYTAGGHRRIALASLLELVRSGKFQLVRPEALGLPATSGSSQRVVGRACDQFAEALLAGDEQACRQIAVDLFLAEHSISKICDEVFATAFNIIGDRWACGDAEVYQERRGCEITLRVLHQLRTLMPAPSTDAPLAMGCAASQDTYALGTSMAELVLTDCKWNAVSLGDDLPFGTIAAAIRTKQPKLFWLSCSFIADEQDFVRGYRELHEEFALDVHFVVGGFALSEDIRKKITYSAFCDNMQHLESFAQTLLSSDKTA